MYTSESLQALSALNKLYADVSPYAASDTTGVWDELLKLISGAVQNILNTAIGSGGKTVKSLIDDVVGKINGVVDSVKTTVNTVTSDIKKGLTGAVSDIEKWVDTSVSGVVKKIDGIFTAIDNTVGKVVDGVTSKIDGIINGIGDAISGAINTLKDKIGEIIDSIENIGRSIGKWITDSMDATAEWINTAIDNVIGGATAWITEAIANVSEWVSTAYENVKTWLKNSMDATAEWINGAIQTVKDGITNTVDSIVKTYNSVKQDITDYLQKAMDWGEGVRKQIEDWFWNTMTSIGGWFANNVLPVWGDVVGKARKIVKTVIDVGALLAKGDYQGAFDLINGLFNDIGLPGPENVLHAILSGIAYFWETIKLQFIPMQVAAQKKAEIDLAWGPIGIDEAATAVFRGKWKDSDFLSNASLNGINKDRAKISLEMQRPILSPGQAQQLFVRGEIKEAEHDNILRSYGFNDNHINEIKALYAVIPGVQDIISMAVKEAFTPAIAERFGQYQDLPDAFVSWAAKQGLSKEWASRYWAAHWDLPSPQMGFDMFQRRIISRDDLILLLKALDVMPFWREKLIDLSYNVPTRVDVRRMYKMGMLSDDQVYNFHLDIGYSPDNARMLTEFTKRYSAPEDESEQDEFKALARSTYSAAYKEHVISTDEYRTFLTTLKYNPDDVELLITLDDYAVLQKDKVFDPIEYRNAYIKLITSGYNRGLFNRDDAGPILVSLGYTQEQAELELSLIDYNRETSLRDMLVQQLHDQYVSFIIDHIQLQIVMNSFNFYPDEVARLIEEWNVERSFRTKRPALTDLKKFFNDGLITLEELLDELRGMGYHEKYISMFQFELEKARV